MAEKITVCVGNYGYYNEGELHDAWIELPKSPSEIKAFLRANRLQDREHEEIYISDYDGVPFGLDSLFTETTRLEDLNLLAMQMQRVDYDEDAVLAYCEACDAPDSVVELMNLLEQSDDIPYYAYDQKGRSPRESMGLTAVGWNPELAQMLESDSRIADAFSFEDYGEAFEQENTLLEDGYYDNCADYPLLDQYDREDFEAMYGFEAAEPAA